VAQETAHTSHVSAVSAMQLSSKYIHHGIIAVSGSRATGAAGAYLMWQLVHKQAVVSLGAAAACKLKADKHLPTF
jgi:hypothetical protein